ncbi:hypothetical protein PR202_gb12216 [Eleusine coracana subsp. coracana]|uniref:Uncharacterized protein n=1 Tax=Eleusine coracana subsp. coracana TaxID=191504 RepID=A0AAV5EMH3_ELECO|nr:hypothetical protein PR202_gb12216 [Eleusine coracana subsp. coracana]
MKLLRDQFLVLIQQLLYTKYSRLINSSFLHLMDSGSILVIRKQLTLSKVALEMYVFLSYVLVLSSKKFACVVHFLEHFVLSLVKT